MQIRINFELLINIIGILNESEKFFLPEINSNLFKEIKKYTSIVLLKNLLSLKKF